MLGNRSRGSFLGNPITSALRWAVALGFATLLACLLACGSERPSGGGGHGDGDSLFPRLPRVTGNIDFVDAHPDNPRHFRVLHITDAEGREWRFHSEGWVGVSVGHLKDHQIQGSAVTVWYEEQPGEIQLARFVGD